jgi:uncharacterized membrane protein YraQ (UPF0718 family)
MSWRNELRALLIGALVFLGIYYLPVESARFTGAVTEALALTRWYAREHVLLCLVPAFFIAGGISVFVSQASVMRYLGAGARKVTAYGVAAVSGTVLAVCSCTVLPLFAGIYGMGAGLGPATTFLYAGPAINALAIILTARVLGVEIGVARAIGAIVFSVVIGLLMSFFFRRDQREQQIAQAAMPEDEDGRPLWQTALTFAAMVAILVFANWGGRGEGFFGRVFAIKWYLTGAAGLVLAFSLSRWYTRGELAEWCEASWGFARQIMPLLLMGVLAAGLLLGRPGHEGLIPSSWIARLVGGNSFGANIFAAVSGAFMYFATLTEVPIIEGLRGSGMHSGPALSLLLSGPAVSLPSILVMRSIMGGKKTAVFLVLVVVLSAVTGTVFGVMQGE